MSGKVYFVSGIDTDAGKSYATGHLAREWNRGGVRTLTQKLVQTGNADVSEDILLHRRIMGVALQPEDEARLTMPEIYPHPASPHLAARLAGRPVDLVRITEATRALAARCDAVLLEGAGGLMVPLTETLLTIDYVKSCGYPVILVTSGKLGSINHSLLSLEALKTRGMRLHALVFNAFPKGDPVVRQDAEAFFRRTLARDWPDAGFVNLPILAACDQLC
jgi:dethiobiotin synthetase